MTTVPTAIVGDTLTLDIDAELNCSTAGMSDAVGSADRVINWHRRR